MFAFESQIYVLPNGFYKQICIKTDLNTCIGWTGFKIDLLLEAVCYNRCQCMSFTFCRSLNVTTMIYKFTTC